MYSVIVPVYNGEKTVTKLFEKTNVFFQNIKSDFEMISVIGKGAYGKVILVEKKDTK
jgi:glycosyltransferase involved in cell wall biosynthesis